MNKNIWLTVGIAGMLLGNPLADARAEVSVQISTGNRPSFVISSAPNFVYLRSQKFSVSVDSPYDIVYYRNYYYILQNGRWYRSSNYRGPWITMVSKRVPYQIRKHRFDDIRRYRDVAYHKPDYRNNRYQRNDDNRRRVLDQRHDANNRRIEDQQNRDANNRRIEEQQNRDANNRRVDKQQKKDSKNNDHENNGRKKE